MRSPLGELVKVAERALERVRNDAPVPLAPADTGGGFGSMFGGDSSGGDPAAQMGLMGSVGTLFAIVDGGATSVSLVDWKLYPKGLTEAERTPDTEVKAHPAIDVLNTPNPFTTRQEFFEVGQQHADLTGEAWTVIARRGTSAVGPPVELWNVRPDRMAPVPHPEQFIAGYVYTTPDGDKIPLEITQVMMIRLPNPMDPYRGMAPIQAVMNDADAIRYGSTWQRNFFLNSAEPGGLLEVPDGKILPDEEFKKLQHRWREQHRGVANAHRVAILEGGLKWVDRKYSIRDMMFTDLRDLSSEQIREAYRFPKPILGTVEDVNRANAEAAELVYGRWYVRPRLERWKQMLNRDFLPMFPGGDRFEFCYDRSQIEPANRELENATLTAQVAAFGALVDKGVPIEQAAEIAGLPDIDMPQDTGQAQISYKEKMELVQKLYLGVEGGVVLTREEGRAALAEAGWEIDPAAWPEEEETESEPVPPQLQLPAPPEEAEQAAMAARWRALAALNMRQVNEATPPADSAIPGRAEVDRAAAELEADWASVLTSWYDQIAATVQTNGNDTQAIAESSLPITYAVDLLTERMDSQYQAGADELWQDARDQGVEADQLGEPDAPDLREQAESAVGELAQAWLDAAVVAVNQVYAEPGEIDGAWFMPPVRNITNTEAADRVREMLADLGTARDRAKLTGTLHRAHNQGRIAQAKQAPKATYVAMEESDGASCDPCRDVDGKEFRSVTAAEKAYKSGGYSKCKGRDRCRGTFTANWS